MSVDYISDTENEIVLNIGLNPSGSLDDQIVDYGNIDISRSKSATLDEEENIIVDHLDEDPRLTSTEPMILYQVFGFNHRVPVLNLGKGAEIRIAFAASQVLVLFDHAMKKRTLVSCHSNCISSICTDSAKKVVVSADKGTRFPNKLCLTDTRSGRVASQASFSKGEGGTECVALTKDGDFLVSLGCEVPQRVSIWRILKMSLSETPLTSLQLKTTETLTHLSVSLEKSSRFLASGKATVVFFSLESRGSDDEMSPSSEPRHEDEERDLRAFEVTSAEKELGKNPGCFTQSVYLPYTQQVITATSKGNLVVWSPVSCLDESGKSGHHMKASKCFHVEDAGILVLAQRNGYILTGSKRGRISMYDNQLMYLTDWVQNFNLGPIASISFPLNLEKSYGEENDLRLIGDFIVSTSNGYCNYIQVENFSCFEILQGSCHHILCIDSHPMKNLTIFGNKNGYIAEYDYVKEEIRQDFQLEFDGVTTVKYAPSGKLIGFGTEKGKVWFVTEDQPLPSPSEAFNCSKGVPMKLSEFSERSQYFCTADSANIITMFYYDEISVEWQLLGRYHSHTKPIRSFLFFSNPDTGDQVVYSLGEDRRLVEYNLTESSRDNVVVASCTIIEQTEGTHAMCRYPCASQETFLLCSTSDLKLKLFNAETKTCRKTVASPPSGGSAVRKLLVPQRRKGERSSHIVFATDVRLGVLKLPLDGNPFAGPSVPGHPVRLDNVSVSRDGEFCFGGCEDDTSMLVWRIDTEAVERNLEFGGTEMESFYSLLEGGKDGELYSEIKNYFSLVQMSEDSGGPSARLHRDVGLDRIADLMRALGYYPTEREIENMMIEVKYQNYLECGKLKLDVSLPEFIKLYLNHRSTIGISKESIIASLQCLDLCDENGEIDMNGLSDTLKTIGEQFTENEITTHLLGLFSKSQDNLPEKLSQDQIVDLLRQL